MTLLYGANELNIDNFPYIYRLCCYVRCTNDYYGMPVVPKVIT